MVSLKKLVAMARKWQNLAALGRKRIASPRAVNVNDTTIVDKGCFVVYSCDGVRFVIPIDFLKNDIFQELLEMAEEEYGLQRDGPIRLPLKAAFMQCTVSQIKRQISKELEEELHVTIASWKCLSTSNMQFEQVQTQLYIQVGNAVVPVARALGYSLAVSCKGIADAVQPTFILPPNFPNMHPSAASPSADQESQ